MLPTIELDLSKTCSLAFNINEGRRSYIGYSFACHLAPLRDAAAQARKSMDRIITETVLAGITERPIRYEALFWYAPGPDMIFLTSCDKRQQFRPMWLRNTPGYFECGSDYVRPNSRPFLHWNGKNLTRLYVMDEQPEQGRTYVSDFGSLFGLAVGSGSEAIVEDMRENPTEYLDYSIVPDDPDEIIRIGDRKCILSHAFCTVAPPRLPLDEDEIGIDI